MSRASLLPTFFIPGAGKSATTTLHELLDQHPKICMSRPKEPLVFTRHTDLRAIEADYARFFSHGAGEPERGESSTTYMLFPESAENIARYVPDARFICILRHPVRRIRSHYRWLRSLGLEWRPYRRAIEEDMRIPLAVEHHIAGYYRFYFEATRYGTQVARLQSLFGRERVLVVTTEELQADPVATSGRCFEFLGLEPFAEVHAVRANETLETTPRRWYAFAWSQTYERPVLRGTPAGRVVRRAIRSLPARLRERPPHAEDEQREREDAAWTKSLLGDEVERLRAITGRRFDEWKW